MSPGRLQLTPTIAVPLEATAKVADGSAEAESCCKAPSAATKLRTYSIMSVFVG